MSDPILGDKNRKAIVNLPTTNVIKRVLKVNPGPAEPRYTLSLQTV